jgi:hypothetical protein
MRGRLAMPPTARRVLQRAREDRVDATRMLAELEPDAQVALVCETPLARRAELLSLLPEPESVVPRLPEAELCFTLKAIGVTDASWLLELASEEQIVAGLDLDAWKGALPDPAALDEWMGAIVEAGPDTLARTLRALDPELVVCFLDDRIDVELKPSGDDDWQPPAGAQTLDGQFWFGARNEGDDLAPIVEMLRVLFERDYWSYFRTLQGVVWELPTENAEWALRWRSGRLEDLGFPSWDEAMSIYAHLREEDHAAIPPGAEPFGVEPWRLPVWLPRLPALAGPGAALFEAIALLEAGERQAVFYAFVALANRVAVADAMPLGDAESTPRAIEKAARFAAEGLEFVAEKNALSRVETLRRVPLERLFQVGANRNPQAARPTPPPEPGPDA